MNEHDYDYDYAMIMIWHDYVNAMVCIGKCSCNKVW